MSRRTALASRLRTLRSTVSLMRITSPPTPGALGRMVLEADSRITEAFGGLLVGATTIQLILGQHDWPYRIWLKTAPLWSVVAFGGFIALALLVGAAGAQATREYNEALDPEHDIPCPYWPLRLVGCAGAAVFFFAVSVAIATTSFSTWGGVRETVLGCASVILAARHLYGRGRGPYA